MQLYVYVCDRCRKREETKSSSPPSYWVEAKITVLEGYSSNKDPEEYLWCKNCWRDIKGLPTTVPTTPPLTPSPITDEDIPLRPLPLDFSK